MIKRVFSLLICVLLAFSLISCTESSKGADNPFTPEEPKEFDGILHFNSDGSFKIMFISDIHSDVYPDNETLDLVKLMLDVENPDLVIFGGDNSVDDTIEEHAKTLDILLNTVIDRKIPWCHVFGNHDRESNVMAEELYNIYLQYDYCVSGDVEELDGIGTYYVPVYGYNSDELKYVVWCMDSHDYSDSGYDCVHLDQVEWYIKTSEEFEKTYGKKINGIMFQHIPVNELRRAAEDPEGTNYHGTALEAGRNATIYQSICCAEINFGQFDALKERGDVQLLLFGHDHYNNFTCVIDGITTGYVGSLADFGGNPVRGTRVVVINENDTANPETYFAFTEDRYYKFYMD